MRPRRRHGTPLAARATGPREGYTLLEMVLVVSLISATAAAGLLVLGDSDARLREQRTRQRLDQIISAVIGETGARWAGEVRLSGFVVDNGRLPVALRELIEREALVDEAECSGTQPQVAAGRLACHRPRAAVFDPSPDAGSGLDNGSGDELTLTRAEESLPKGLRRLLSADLDAGRLRDGWGNVSIDGDDALNHGWRLNLPATESQPWRLTSLGADNAAGGAASDATLDLDRSVQADDWSTDMAGWSVRLTNASGVTRPGPGEFIGVSLLVWENREGGGRWKRLTTQLDDTPLAAGASHSYTLPAGGHSGGSLSTRVPVGEHLALAVVSPDASAQDGNDQPLEINGHRISAVVRLFSGAARPHLELVLR
ncbi:MAG: hypothetical protein RLY78_1502 [Pseudomonadota bacterium]